jgi:hypothetical protein
MRTPSSRLRGLLPHRRDERGQAIVLFAFVLVGIIAMAGLLIDGGLAWSNKRQAQTAADTAALAAAKAIVSGGNAFDAASLVAGMNGFLTKLDCNGNQLPNGGVTVNHPPLSGPHAGDTAYVEVITTRAMHTTFSGAVGASCFMVSARAVAMAVVVNGVAQCSFCSTNSSTKNHTLVLNNGSRLRVDGDIIVNSSNGGYTPGVCTRTAYKVCGDGFDIFGAGGTISAQRISVHGGWETHNYNIARADGLAPNCVDNIDPLAYGGANVCIHMPLIADPFNDPAYPGNIIADPPVPPVPVPGQGGCPADAASVPGTPGKPATMAISFGSVTLCPGVYSGGILANGTASVKMLAGIYYIDGGGFTITGSATVDGSAGVMIYNAANSGSDSTSDPAIIDNLPTGARCTPSIAKLGGTNNAGLASTLNPTKPGLSVTFWMTVQAPSASGTCASTPTGVVTFFDGSTPICTDVPTADAGNLKGTASCTTSFDAYGTRAISAVFCPPSITTCVPPFTGFSGATDLFNPAGDALTETVLAPANTSLAPISITTGGEVTLWGPTSGAYAGLTIFQVRTSSSTITLSPHGTGAACQSGWMDIGVPNGTPPPACGSIGGLRGTIYAGNTSALVYITASGLANLQVIAGMIQIDSNAYARFAYTPQYFANGTIRLIE